MKSRYTTISVYFIGEYLFSFGVAFLFFFFVFFVNHMILMAEEVLSKNVPLFQVLRLIFYSLPTIISFSLPFAALVGALMAVGRFSSDNEVLALQASGITLARLFRPVLLVSLLLTLSTFVFNDYFIPLSTIRFTRLYREVLFSNPALELEPHSVKYYQDSIIVTGGIEENVIDGLLIIDRDVDKNRRVILAETALLEKGGDHQEGVISLRLENVTSHTTPEKILSEYDYSQSREMIYNILLKDITLSMRNPGPREMSTRDIYKAILEKRAALEVKNADNLAATRRAEEAFLSLYNGETENLFLNRIPPDSRRLSELLDTLRKTRNRETRDRSLQIYELEFHKKFSLPVACLVFAFLAFPVGLFTRRSGRTVGFGIGVLISILYYGLLFAGQTMGFQLNIRPAFAMWLPNLLIFVSGVVMFTVRVRR